MRHLLAAALAVMLALPVAAQDFDEGREAHERGDSPRRSEMFPELV